MLTLACVSMPTHRTAHVYASVDMAPAAEGCFLGASRRLARQSQPLSDPRLLRGPIRLRSGQAVRLLALISVLLRPAAFLLYNPRSRVRLISVGRLSICHAERSEAQSRHLAPQTAHRPIAARSMETQDIASLPALGMTGRTWLATKHYRTPRNRLGGFRFASVPGGAYNDSTMNRETDPACVTQTGMLLLRFVGCHEPIQVTIYADVKVES